MENKIKLLLEIAINKLKNEGILPKDIPIDIKVCRTKNKEHGQYSTNVALILSKYLNYDKNK